MMASFCGILPAEKRGSKAGFPLHNEPRLPVFFRNTFFLPCRSHIIRVRSDSLSFRAIIKEDLP